MIIKEGKFAAIMNHNVNESGLTIKDMRFALSVVNDLQHRIRRRRAEGRKIKRRRRRGRRWCW